ncbi:hypothetical protein TSUD_118150 [Trifolium subterraneum]|uniref:Uncharacterized protein n=1 Tax=Trifolium subterraneum TaxID=3900 RepID=A0A2Z6PNK6_TRISU|nr:hypothetical protein TSUD_118150 [Trifolium subterraneum]
MAEDGVGSVLQELYKFALEERALLTGVEKEFIDIKDDLESIQALLKDADRVAAYEEEEQGYDKGVKTWVKQLREASFRIEDVIDEYNMYEAQKNNHSIFITTLQMIPGLSRHMNPLHKIASEIQDIKSSLGKIKERSERFQFDKSEIRSGSYRGTKAPRIGDPRMAPYFIEENQVVGFEEPRDELVNCLVEGTNDLLLVSVVGMGGLGKTTLAKHVFDNPLVKEHFHYRSFITVSQSYSMRELLTEMIKKFCKDSNERIPKGLQNMDDVKFITQVREYLESKKYLVVFDDVWEEKFSDEIKHALVSNNNGSRIIVTTRIMHVAEYFKESFLVRVHVLQRLPSNKAWELFCKKTFRGQCECPTELVEMSTEIVERCGGLPLAIVAIGGLLSTKAKETFEWTKVSQNLRMELQRNVHLTDLMKILSLSYDDLPYHLKSCMLYFGIYPEDYTINRKRLTRQWMAEGFIKNEEVRPLEEVSEEYLTELIQRSLVDVSAVGFDGKVRSVKVHDVSREVIIRKMKDLSFCHLMNKDGEQVTIGVTRRFSIAAFSNSDLKNSGTRAIFVFDKGDLPEHFMDGLSSKFKLLKVLDFQNSLLTSLPDNMGNLFHLRYLNLSHTKVTILPKSIGNLVYLETLDLRQTKVHQLPQEINKLTKLRLLPVYYRRYEGHYDMLNFTTGVQLQEGIGGLVSLQKLYFLEADYGGIGLIQELKMLTQLRKLGIRCVRGEFGNALCATIQAMNRLESLNITAKAKNEIIDLDSLSVPPPNLKVLNLKSRLTKLPDWIPNLNNLVKLRLGLSNFEDDPLDSLKKLPNLLRLNLWDNAFSGESLHFQVGGFPKLKEVDLTRLDRLSSITIDKKALQGLQHFRFKNNPQLKVLPQDLQNLKNLQFLGFAEMPAELVDSIEQGGPCHWIINHIPLVQIRQNEGSKFHDYKLYRIPTQPNA